MLPQSKRTAGQDAPLQPVRVPRLATLDRLCGLLVDPPQVTSSVIVLAQDGALQVIGSAGCSFSSVPSQFRRLWQGGDFVELHRLDQQPAMRIHPLVDGTLDRWRSVLILPLRLAGAICGFAGLASRSERGAFTLLERKALYHSTGLAEGHLAAELALRQAGNGLLATLESLRR